MCPGRGGWVKGINWGQIPVGMCGTERNTHKEKVGRVEEKRSQKRGRTEEGHLFVDYCVTREAPHTFFKESWTFSYLFLLNLTPHQKWAKKRRRHEGLGSVSRTWGLSAERS